MKNKEPEKFNSKNKFSTIEETVIFQQKGPWKTKSNAELRVLFALSNQEVLKYLQYNQNELDKIPQDIRGIRAYSVTNLKKESEGGREFHKVRKELFFLLAGSVKLTLEDIYGGTKNLILDSQKGIYIPPFVLHTYKTLEDNSNFLVLANTLFDVDNPRTHDTFSEMIFKEIQRQYQVS
ncbi:MAG TPA: WxcM-like domain-containing protein [Candidatus Nanoarchaeia archaeon]|nr:WxcM-like domain-containing protein [Candidatus Nanoarchaeia archaeon]